MPFHPHLFLIKILFDLLIDTLSATRLMTKAQQVIYNDTFPLAYFIHYGEVINDC